MGRQRPRSARFARVGVLLATIFTSALVPMAQVEAAPNPSGDLDQCANGKVTAPVQCTGANWQNGNVNENQAHYVEGDSVPYRMKFGNLTVGGSHVVRIEWDTTQGTGAKHATDFLTSFNRTEATADPCSGIAGCGAGAFAATTFPIPADPHVTALGVTPIAGNFTMYGATITNVSAYTLSSGATYPATGQSKTSIDITFSASVVNPVMAWAGHIATRADWGPDSSAVAISGSPYHMRFLDLDGSGGNQDRSLSASAVIYPATVTIIKHSEPPTATAFAFTASPAPMSGFNLTDNDAASDPSQVFTMDVPAEFTTYTVAETNPMPASQLTALNCVETGGTANTTTSLPNRTATIVVDEGETITCTFTNTGQPGTLIVNKVVTNDNGGTKTASDFGFQVNGGSTTAWEADGSNSITVTPGLYSVVEPEVNGYTTTYNNCTNVNVPAGGTATCTVTNNDQSATLIVNKVVVNDNGGTKVASDFGFKVNGGSTVAFEADGSNSMAVNAGQYSVTEPAADGYTTTYDNCSQINIPIGGTATCTITNNDQPATLIVNKVVINNDGGTKVASDFGFKVNGGSTIAFEAEGSNSMTVNAGTYSVVEPAVNGYSTSYENCSNLQIPNGGTATCTITNDDNAGTLIVKKIVINNDGGTKDADDFGFKVNNGTLTSFEADGQNDLTVPAGTYTVSEPLGTEYTTTYDNCTSVQIPNGGTATCTITNDDKPATLVVEKIVINNNGGTKDADDFGFKVNNGSTISFEADGSNSMTVNAGTYSVVEPAASGYTTTYDNCSNLQIPNGGTATCVVTNNDQPGTLIVNKVVINNDGGTKEADDFGFKVNNGTLTSFEADGSNQMTVDAGTYTISEPLGTEYTTSYDNCTSVQIPNGGTATCTITNDDKPATLIVEKVVINNNGGAKEADDFGFKVNGGSTISFEADGSNSMTVDAGTYSVVEPAASGYSTSYENCSELQIPNGGTATCTITNNDDAGMLIVKKIVINDNGGKSEADDFGFKVNGGSTTSFEADGQNDLAVDAGTYSVTEPAADGYTTTYDNCSNVEIVNGGTATCTITNNDQPGTLIVEKVVVNDDGGTKEADDFGFKVNGGSTTSFQADGSNSVTVDAGTYTVTEPAADGYSTTYDNCSELQIPNGGTATCTITNDDQPGTLIVNKIVINDDGGTATADSFEFAVDGDDPVSFEADGSNEFTVPAGVYEVVETPDAGYTTSYDGCSEVVVANGGEASCTITNDDKPGTLIVEKIVINDDEGTAEAEDFSFDYSAGENFVDDVSFESDGSNELTVDAGVYTVIEKDAKGYEASYENCAGIEIPNGGTATCTITNDDDEQETQGTVVTNPSTTTVPPVTTTTIVSSPQSLPFTGGNSGLLFWIACCAVGLGLALVRGARRRRGSVI